MLTPVTFRVILSVRAGDLYQVGGFGKEQEGVFGIAAQGYEKLNSAAGLTIFQPPTRWLDGEEVSNPTVQTDENGDVRSVRCLCYSGGHTPTGQYAIRPSDVIWDVDAYLNRDLFRLATKDTWDKQKSRFVTPDFGEGRGLISAAGITPQLEKQCFVRRIGNGMAVAFDLTDPRFRTCMDTHMNRKVYMIRIAETVSARRAIAHHPTIAITQVRGGLTKSEKADFSFAYEGITYRGDMDESRLKEVQAAIVSGAGPDRLQQAASIPIPAADVHDIADAEFDEAEEGADDDGRIKQLGTPRWADTGEEPTAEEEEPDAQPVEDETPPPKPAAKKKPADTATDLKTERKRLTDLFNDSDWGEVAREHVKSITPGSKMPDLTALGVKDLQTLRHATELAVDKAKGAKNAEDSEG